VKEDTKVRFGSDLVVGIVVLVLLVFGIGLVQAGGVIEEWVARYNGPANDSDYAFAIALDVSGNVYVTGYSYGSGTNDDYATIKYDSAGNQQWVSRYNGPGNDADSANAIAVDGSGNVYVTGASYGSATDYDYATIKYDPAGSELWIRRYNGPGNGDDCAIAVVVDGSGNIYVTGYSYGSDTYADYATIKYDPNGDELWVRRYNGPENLWDEAFAIAVDSSGNIYLTGESCGFGTYYDYTTIKYDPNGNELWVRRYNGLGNDYDGASAIAVDSSSNIYVTGESIGFGTRSDYATIKYDPNGNELWVHRYNGLGNDYDGASAIAVDGFGNIYVAGASIGSGTSYDYATIKYDSAGGEQWVLRYNGPGNLGDWANDIVVDSSGDIYVTGESSGSSTNRDYATIKYDPAGNQRCVLRYNGLGNSGDGAQAIVVGGSGNVYVTGGSDGSGTNHDYATIKYHQYDFVLTMQTSPPEITSLIPYVGEHYYLSGAVVNISAQRFVNCPDVYVFDRWEGDVNDPNSTNTTVVMNADKTVTAVFDTTRQCGDECHPYPSADLDKNCKVNFLDLGLFAAQWLECTDPTCE
jgi:hypothetical protein